MIQVYNLNCAVEVFRSKGCLCFTVPSVEKNALLFVQEISDLMNYSGNVYKVKNFPESPSAATTTIDTYYFVDLPQRCWKGYTKKILKEYFENFEGKCSMFSVELFADVNDFSKISIFSFVYDKGDRDRVLPICHLCVVPDFKAIFGSNDITEKTITNNLFGSLKCEVDCFSLARNDLVEKILENYKVSTLKELSEIYTVAPLFKVLIVNRKPL